MNPNDKSEFIGQIIDIFEDFLTEKMTCLDESADSIICGENYDFLKEKIDQTMTNWQITTNIDTKGK